jgi:hypothetical protein
MNHRRSRRGQAMIRPQRRFLSELMRVMSQYAWNAL